MPDAHVLFLQYCLDGASRTLILDTCDALQEADLGDVIDVLARRCFGTGRMFAHRAAGGSLVAQLSPFGELLLHEVAAIADRPGWSGAMKQTAIDEVLTLAGFGRPA